MATYGSFAEDIAGRRLGPYADGYSDDDLASELDMSARMIVGDLPSIGAYDALSEADQQWFDQAVGVYTAIRLLAGGATADADGAAQLQIGSFKLKMAQPDGAERDRWAAEFARALGYMTAVKASRARIAETTHNFGVSGRTRRREAAGLYSLPRSVAALLPAGWGGDRRGGPYVRGVF